MIDRALLPRPDRHASSRDGKASQYFRLSFDVIHNLAGAIARVKRLSIT